jgi:hypothetical protein
MAGNPTVKRKHCPRKKGNWKDKEMERFSIKKPIHSRNQWQDGTRPLPAAMRKVINDEAGEITGVGVLDEALFHFTFGR